MSAASASGGPPPLRRARRGAAGGSCRGRAPSASSAGGGGDGERKFRGQHPGEAAWKKFTDMLAEGKRHREKTGKSLMVPRYDIVPIPEHLRGHLAQNSILE